MKNALTILLLCGLAFAQTKTATKSGVRHTASSHAPAVYRVKFTTTKGPVIIEVTRAWAPLGADRFYSLVRSGFFTGAPFFRVIPGFMAQFGLSPKPALNQEWEKRNLRDDSKPYQSNKRGTVSFATAGPNTRTTQLFINYGDNSRLDPDFAPIGQVVEGMELVDQFYSGYGDTSTKEDQIANGGQAYLDRYMPHIDKIIRASIEPAAPKPADAKY
jgi:peptidyl-prolyl cis-trans isomerase A (cyclophilin A)